MDMDKNSRSLKRKGVKITIIPPALNPTDNLSSIFLKLKEEEQIRQTDQLKRVKKFVQTFVIFGY